MLRDAASRMSRTRSPDSPSVRLVPACPDALRELRHDALQRFLLGEGGRDHVAGAVGDDRLTPIVGVQLRWVGEVDAAVVDRDPLRRVEVIPDERSVGPADRHRADLDRAEPVDVKVCDRAARKLKRQVGDACLAGPDRVGPVGRDRERRLPRPDCHSLFILA